MINYITPSDPPDQASVIWIISPPAPAVYLGQISLMDLCINFQLIIGRVGEVLGVRYVWDFIQSKSCNSDSET